MSEGLCHVERDGRCSRWEHQHGGTHPMREATVAEATPEEARAIALSEIRQAAEADSLEHILMHMRSALIWLGETPQ